MRLFLLTCAVWAAAVVQGSLLIHLDWPFRPNLPLLVALCGAWLFGSSGGAWLGFCAGLVMASLSGRFVGSYTFSYLAVGWLVGQVRGAVYGERPLIALPMTGVGTLLGETIFFLWNPRHAASLLTILGEAGLNLLLSPLVYFPLAWIVRRGSVRDNRGA